MAMADGRRDRPRAAVSVEATCRDCDFERAAEGVRESDNVVEAARRHRDSTRHTVIVDRVRTWQYEPEGAVHA